MNFETILGSCFASYNFLLIPSPMRRLPRHAGNSNRGLEAAVVAAAGWVERLNSGMTSRLGVISHALVANGIVMRVLSERRYELAADRQRETMKRRRLSGAAFRAYNAA